MTDPPYLTLKTRDGIVYEGFQGRDVKSIVDGRDGRKGFEVRTPSGVIVELWVDELAEWGRKPPR
jgi:hypothetical protein